MSEAPPKHAHDADLPPVTVKKRRQHRYFAHWMLTMAVITAIPGWTLYAMSMRSAQKLAHDVPLVVIAAYVLLITSSITLVLGLWYLLLAQVRRIARITGEDDSDDTVPPQRTLCPNCGWFFDSPDRFCRHCGKPLGASIPAPRDDRAPGSH